MATVQAFIRIGEKTKNNKNNKNKDVNIRFRLRDGEKIQLFHTSELVINSDKWDEKKQAIKANCVYDTQKRNEFNKAVNDRKNAILDIYSRNLAQRGNLSSDWLNTEIDKVLYPEKYEAPEQSFFDAFNEFLTKHPLSRVRKNNFRVVIRALSRYELYTRQTVRGKKDFSLSLDTITADTLQSISDFLKNEHIYYDTFPELYKAFPEYHKQKPRGQNTINDIMTKIRTFFLWCVKNKKTQNRPFDLFRIDECVYGTPFYISIDERNLLYNTDLSHRPALATQRDIFVFQCLIGCRVGDFYKLTKQNIINGAIEYIARKTKDRKPVTVRVPLNTVAKEILERYADFEGNMLFPFISQQKYNDAIKDAFTIAGITRPVVICDPLTRENVIRPINEVASSHLARRCFVGNMYKKAKDQNLVSALSGHKQGSKAFARYREIDEDMRNELVKMLE
jgi:integrase